MLTGRAIRDAIEAGLITIDPFVPEHIGPNSVDLRLSNKLLKYKGNSDDGLPIYCLDMRRANPTSEITIPRDGLILEPECLYLGCTIERTHTDHFIPQVDGRSSVGRLGIKVHLTAGFGDIGFNGPWTLEIEVTHRIRVYPGVRICQVSFIRPDGPIEQLYTGRYQSSVGPAASRFHLP